MRPSRRPLERPRRIAARMPSRCSRRVRASRTNGRSRERDAQASQASRCAGARRGRRGGRAAAAPRAAGRRGRGGGWRAGLRRAWRAGRSLWCSGALSSDQRVPLTQRPVRGVRAVVGVPFVAADLVGRAGAEADDVEGVKADLGVRDGGADRALVLAAHVDRDRPDRLLAVAELVEEGLQGGAVAARRAPHDRAGGVVGDRGQVAMMAPIADLVDADHDQAARAGARRGDRRPRARRSGRSCASRPAAAA